MLVERQWVGVIARKNDFLVDAEAAGMGHEFCAFGSVANEQETSIRVPRANRLECIEQNVNALARDQRRNLAKNYGVGGDTKTFAPGGITYLNRRESISIDAIVHNLVASAECFLCTNTSLNVLPDKNNLYHPTTPIHQ